MIIIKRFQKQLLKTMFDNETECYVLNEMYSDKRIVKGLITNPSITNQGNLHFHSDTLFKRGDVLSHADAYYIINSDIVRLRGIKYKGIGYYCNWNHTFDVIERVIVGTDNYGAPIYDEIKVGEQIIYGVLRFVDASNPNSEGISFPNPTYRLIVKDEPMSRKFLNYNATFKLNGLDVNVYNVAVDKEGLLELSLRFGDART